MAPSDKETLQALTAEDVKPTEAHVSLAKFLTDFGPVEVTAEQAWAFIMGHRIWQSSPDRAAEKVALKESRNEGAEEKRIQRELARAEKLEKAAEAKRLRDEKAAAKKAKDADSDDDLTETDDEALNTEEGETTEEAKPKRRRRVTEQSF